MAWSLGFRDFIKKYQPSYQLQKKAAFTLAEVLITLGIIGVVAAMTIPVLIQKYDERATVVKVKQFYSIFSEAYKLAVIENGPISTWGLSDSETIEDDDGNVNFNETSINNINKFYEKILPYLKNAQYKELEVDSNNPEATTGGITLANGIALREVWLTPSRCTGDVKCGDVYIVTDGGAMEEYENNEKKYRKYTFNFSLKKDYIIPTGLNESEFEENCLSGKNTTHCTGWIIQNGNMDYLHCKDLSWNGKNKCDD